MVDAELLQVPEVVISAGQGFVLRSYIHICDASSFCLSLIINAV